VAGASLALPGIACSAETLTIGQSITLQDGRNAHGSAVLAGVRLAIDAANRAGGVQGRQVVLRTLDDGNRVPQAEANARQLVSEGVFALFGSVEGGPSGAVARVATETGTPFIGPMAGSPGLRRPLQRMVYPVRAEHLEEFRALIAYGRRTGLRRVALFHSDSATGREHLANVERLASEAAMGFAGGQAFGNDVTEAQLDTLVQALAAVQADLVINHGSPGVYERLIRRARAAGSTGSFWGVNSGSTPLVAALGPLARSMVFAQVVPSPFARKTALTRDYQALWRAAWPDVAFGYSSLEGFATARVLLAALAAAGRTPTRASLLAALAAFDLDLGGMQVQYRPDVHTGSRFVDLAMVTGEGRFIQ
jgi:ABC-type branched-subunit amino acid transport system substrate-binding protein